MLLAKRAHIDSAGGRDGVILKFYIKRYELVVDDIKFIVDEDLYENCFEGDKLIFNYAAKSKYLLSIE